ncbi:hypothetical protein [Streptomyces sp. MK37H]|uniref:hypothetical protein n=1 Tax=Streptomyces sp. MK37H TaxID=2699117 RepID=UPI001B374430|nr:hypothetical protein [Streptomyces sp. MK37H]MBP8532847.1 hypothetical protein [Streptomyces sp. MK37H]
MTLPMAESPADAFSDFDCEASLKRIAPQAVSRVTDKMDHCARMVKAESGSRARSQNYGLPPPADAPGPLASFAPR